MKRKLVDFAVFNEMNNSSITTAIKELVEAEEHLARALDVDELKVKSFNEATVIYEQSDGTFLRANYAVKNDRIFFEDVQQLIVDQDSEKKESKSFLRSMLEAILEDNDVEANKNFGKYMDLASRRYKRECAQAQEGVVEEAYARLYGSPERTKGKSSPVISYRSGSKDPKKVRAARKAHLRHRSSYLMGARKRHRNRSKERARRSRYKRLHGRLRALNSGLHYTGKRKKVNEWSNLAYNVFGYADMHSNSHIISETTVAKVNDALNITMPTAKARNEGKIIKMHFDNMLKTDVKILRETARRLVHDAKFCQMVANVKTYNNISDNKGLEESIGSLVSNFPAVLYLTQPELAKVIATALDNNGVMNYDDNTCNFMAEGILRSAHHAYTERVDRIVKLANKEIQESDDKYIDFQTVVSEFFPTLDESTQLEMKMFEDLYNAAVDISKIAVESENEVVRNEAREFISDLEAVLDGRMVPSLELAVDVADWIEDLAEANIQGASEDWSVVKTPHHTISGDHPQMAKNAKVPGNPGQYPGDWGDPAPMIGQDSNAWNHGDEARNRSWGNKGGKNVWPDLSNPIVPAAADFKIKGEKSIENDDDLGTWGSSDSDMWPQLQNPYCPKSLIPRQKVQPDNAVE